MNAAACPRRIASHRLMTPRASLIVALALVTCLLHAQESYDRTFVVNDTRDSPDTNLNDGVPDANMDVGQQVTLRAALMQAGALGGRTLITFARNMTVTNLNGQQFVPGNITIRGLGTEATVIDADRRGRVLTVGSIEDRTVYSVRLENLTLRNGVVVADTSGLVANAGIANYWSELALSNVVMQSNYAAGDLRYAHHGAIGSTGPRLTLEDCVFANNGADAEGGAVGCPQGGALTIRRCVFRGNRAARGGALRTGVDVVATDSLFVENVATVGEGGAIHNNGILQIDNCTFSGNQANGQGGALYDWYGGGTFRHVTLAFNHASQGGGAIYHSAAAPYPEITLQNCLLAFNTPNNGSGATTRIVDGAGNVATDGTCNTPSQRQGDPLVGPLEDHGGSTLTHSLFAGSPALDVPGAANLLTTDQRGQPRPQDGDGDTLAAPDAGAYEAAGVPPAPTVSLTVAPGSLVFGEVAVGTTVPKIVVTLRNAGPLSVTVSAIGLASLPPFTLDLQGGSQPIGSLPAAIPVGQQRTFTIGFEPESPGSYQTELTVHSNDADEPLQSRSVAGESRLGLADLRAVPATLDFGPVFVGRSVDLALTLTNAGDGTLELGALTWTPGSDAAFTIPSDPVSGTVLAPNDAVGLTVRCAPTAAGTLAATLQIPSNDPDASPLLVSVTAEGIQVPILAQTAALTLDGGQGNDAVYGVALDSAGKLLGAGSFAVATSDATGFLVKYGSSWTNTLEMGPVGAGKDDSTDQFLDVAVDSTDHVIGVGVKSGSWNLDGYHQAVVVRKLSPEGALVWEETYHDFAWNAGRAVAVDAQDNLFVVGNVYTSFTINNQWVILKYNSAGQLQPGFPIKVNFSDLSTPWDLAHGVAVGPDGRFVVVGQRAVTDNNLDWHVRCYEANGTLAWEDTFSGTALLHDVATDVAIDRNGNVAVAGYSNHGADNGTQANYDWLVIQYTAGGGRAWTYQYESAAGRSETCAAVLVDALDQVLVGGNMRNNAGVNQWRVVQLNGQDGSEIAEQLWESGGSQSLHDLALRDGQLLIGGSRQGAIDQDAALVAGLYVGQPELSVSPPSLAFGSVVVGESAQASLTLHNRGDQDRSFAAPTGTDALPAPFHLRTDLSSGLFLPAGSSAEIHIAFQPAVPGSYDALFVLRETAAGAPSLQVPLSGTAVDPDPLGNEVFVHAEDGGYGADYGTSVAWDRDGILVRVSYLAAQTSPAFGTSGLVRKFAASPWSDTLEEGQVVSGVKDDSSDSFFDVAVDSQNRVIVAGQQSGSWSSQGYHQAMVIRKYSPDGTLLWSRLYHNYAWNAARGVALDTQDNIYVTGNAFTSFSTYNQWAVLKYTPDGALVDGFPVFHDQGTLSTPIDVPYDIAAWPDGGFVVVGQVAAGTENLDWHIRQYQADRQLAGADTYDHAGLHDIARSVAIDSTGNFVVGGCFNKGSDNGASADYDWLIVKYDRSNQQRLWTATFESEPGRSEQCIAVAVDGLDRVLAGGTARDESGNLHGCLLQLSAADGMLLARRDWPGATFAGVQGIAVRQHDIALTGYAQLDSIDIRTVVQRVPPLQIHSWHVDSNGVTLQWLYPMQRVAIQHTPSLTAPDWKPLAENLSTTTWAGSLPEGEQGFLRAVEP